MRPSPDPLASVTPPERARLRSGLEKLLEAFDSAARVQRDPWDFALQIGDLVGAGLASADLRWLSEKAYVQHAVEETKPGDNLREFGNLGGLQFSDKSCFVLTEAGARAARLLLAEVPTYDRELRQLWWRGKLIKQFTQPAPDQHAILSSFQELGWPRRIDDPLPRKVRGRSPKLRLRDAISRLNRHQQHQLIRFRGDGTGNGVLWEFLEGLDV